MNKSGQIGATLETRKEKRNFDSASVAMFMVGIIAVMGAVASVITKSDPLAFLGTCVTALVSLAGGITRSKK